jgi:hypothetical protein
VSLEDKPALPFNESALVTGVIVSDWAWNWPQKELNRVASSIFRRWHQNRPRFNITLLLDVANVPNTLLADQNIMIDVYLPKYSGSSY